MSRFGCLGNAFLIAVLISSVLVLAACDDVFRDVMPDDGIGFTDMDIPEREDSSSGSEKQYPAKDGDMGVSGDAQQPSSPKQPGDKPGGDTMSDTDASSNTDPKPSALPGDTPQTGPPVSDPPVEDDAAISFPYQFSAVDLYGNNVTDRTLGEKEVFFVHLWATWCPPCIVEMPDFPELMRLYGDRVGFIALLTDYDSNLRGAIDIVESSGISDSFIMIDAYTPGLSSVLDLLQSGYVPTSVLVSRHGVSEQIVGAYGMGYAAFIDELLR